MAKFVYVYTGGQPAETAEAQAESMEAWTSWFGTLGSAVVEIGNPFGAASTVTAGGAAAGGASKLTGYSVIEAKTLEDAAAKAVACPAIGSGGGIEVYEAMEM